jgi:hypothetical protein
MFVGHRNACSTHIEPEHLDSALPDDLVSPVIRLRYSCDTAASAVLLEERCDPEGQLWFSLLLFLFGVFRLQFGPRKMLGTKVRLCGPRICEVIQ